MTANLITVSMYKQLQIWSQKQFILLIIHIRTFSVSNLVICLRHMHTPFFISRHVIHCYVADARYAGKVNPPGCWMLSFFGYNTLSSPSTSIWFQSVYSIACVSNHRFIPSERILLICWFVQSYVFYKTNHIYWYIYNFVLHKPIDLRNNQTGILINQTLNSVIPSDAYLSNTTYKSMKSIFVILPLTRLCSQV